MKDALLSIVVCGAGMIAVSTAAIAAEADQTIAVADQGSPKVRAAVSLVAVPMARLADPGELVRSEPTAGAMASFDFLSRHNLFIGVASRYTPGLKADGGNGKSTRDFDLLLRLGYDARVSDRFHAYGYLAPGYSFLIGLDAITAQGPVLGFNAGGLFDLTTDLFCLAELGYQAGFQLGVGDNTQIPFSVGLIQIGLGVGARI